MSEQKKLFCFGFGYTAKHLALELQKQGFKIAGTTRDIEQRDALREQGIEAYVFDEGAPLVNPEITLKGVTHILVTAPPTGQGDTTYGFHADEFRYIESLQWFGYLSATCVYGNHNGDWVDEETEIKPSSMRGSRRTTAERQILSLWKNDAIPVHVFRLAGIYGPGRSAIDTVKAGFARRIDKPGQIFSRIHIDDIIQVLLASMAKPSPGSIYNVSDDLPSTSHEVIAYACQLLGIDPPELISWEDANLSPMANSFYKENKRVANQKIKEELGVTLKYPNYRKGLKAIVEESGVNPFV